MKFMNTWEIDNAQRRWSNHPVLGLATKTLANLRDAADANSDGWCYWPKPARAAHQLMELIGRGEATSAQLRKAYAPLKSLQTRTGLQFAIEHAAPVRIRHVVRGIY